MKTVYEAKYKKPGRETSSPVQINGVLAEHVFVESEVVVEHEGKRYEGFRMLILVSQE